MKANLKSSLVTLTALAAMAGPLTCANAGELQAATMKNRNLKVTVGERVTTATLEDNATSRDFVSLLPLTLVLKDYESTEKVADLPKALSTHAAPAGFDPVVGDLAYYAPWGNLAIFYKDFGYSRGLIKIARITTDMAAFSRSGSLIARIELAEQ